MSGVLRGALIAVLLVAGCGSPPPAGGEAPLVIVLAPAYDAGAVRLGGLSDALGAALGRPVAIEVAASEAEAVSTFASSRWDAGLLPLFDYLFCAQEYGVQAGARIVRKGGAEVYAGDVVVGVDSEITELSQLQGKAVAFVDHTSTSGFVLPMALLVGAGVEVEPVFAGSHAATLARLKEGAVVAAATYDAAVKGDGAVRVLARTEEIPNEPLFFRAGTEPALREALVAALRAYAKTEAGQAVLAEMAGIEGFAPAIDEDYAAARAAVEAAGMRVEDLVERGWWIANANRGPMWGFEP